MNGAPIIAFSDDSYFIIAIYHKADVMKLKKPMYLNLAAWHCTINYKISTCSSYFIQTLMILARGVASG
jgi:hypothetical protein